MPLFRKSVSKPSQSSLFRSVHEDLRQAAWKGDTGAVLELIKEGAKFIPNKEGRTALHMAAMKGHMDVVRVLIEHGCDLNSQDKLGYTAVHRAVLEGHSEIVRLLVDTNAVNVDKQDFVQENTALHDAAWHGYNMIVESILSAKSNVYIRNKTGATALHLACQNGHNRSARLLVQHGCKPDVKDKYDDTPLHTSCRYIHAGVTRVLLSANANPNEQNKNGDTPLHLACNLGQKKVSRMLLDAGAKADVKNKQGETPIDIALRKQLTDLVDVLKLSLKQAQKSSCENVAPAATTARPSRSKIRERLQAAKDAGSTWQLLFQDWAPYGLENRTTSSGHTRQYPHLYPADSGFSNPAVTPSKPVDENGHQYCVDLSGNLRKAPIACYCAPFFYQLAKHNNEAHLELLEEIDACQNNLSNEISDLRQVTERKIDDLHRAAKCQRTYGNGNEQRQKQGWHRLLSTTKRRFYCAGETGEQQQAMTNARLVRSKSESEIETDIERGRTNAIAEELDDSDSASNASDDLYLDRRCVLRNRYGRGANYTATISRSTSKAVSPPAIGNAAGRLPQAIAGSVQHVSPTPLVSPSAPVVSQGARRRDAERSSDTVHSRATTFDETLRQFNKLESDSLPDSSSTTPTTIGSCSGMSSSHRCTPDHSVRSSIYSSQSGCSCLSSSQLSNSKSLQPSLDSGYGGGSVKAEHELDPAQCSIFPPSGSTLDAFHQRRVQQPNRTVSTRRLEGDRAQQRASCDGGNQCLRVEAETQTDAINRGNRKPTFCATADSHEYTELECILRTAATAKLSTFGCRRPAHPDAAKPPPVLPIPPPPRKPLPPLPIDNFDASPPKRSIQQRGTRYNPTTACLSTNV